MNISEKIRGYIKRAGVEFPRNTPYQMRLSEVLELANMAKVDTCGAICLAFDCGRAKGVQSVKAAKEI